MWLFSLVMIGPCPWNKHSYTNLFDWGAKDLAYWNLPEGTGSWICTLLRDPLQITGYTYSRYCGTCTYSVKQPHKLVLLLDEKVNDKDPPHHTSFTKKVRWSNTTWWCALPAAGYLSGISRTSVPLILDPGEGTKATSIGFGSDPFP